MCAALRLQIEDLPRKYRAVQGCAVAQIHTQSAVMYRAPSHCLYQIFLLHSWLYHQTGPPGLFSKKTVWLFCLPRCYDLLTAIYFLYSRKLMYIFFSPEQKKQKRGWIFLYDLVLLPVCQGHAEDQIFSTLEWLCLV